MTTVPEAGGVPAPAVPPLFAQLVDDARLLGGSAGHRPAMAEVLRTYLANRADRLGALVGLLVCPVSRLAELVAELVKARPATPVDVSLAVDTGLGEVPKALSLAASRTALLTPRTVEMPAPSDVDATWLERVSEFVPEDVVPVVEPRRPDPAARAGWLEGVRRVAEHGCSPKLRCGGERAGAFPGVDEVVDFLAVVTSSGRPFKAGIGPRRAVRHVDDATGYTHHGSLNLLAAVARSLHNGDVAGALSATDGAALAAELSALDSGAVQSVRGVFAGFGTTAAAGQADELAALDLLRAGG